MSGGRFSSVFSWLERIVAWLQDLFKATAIGIIVFLGIQNYGQIRESFAGFIKRLSQAESVSSGGTTIVLAKNVKEVEKIILNQKLTPYYVRRAWNEKKSQYVGDITKNLSFDQIVRLLGVGILNDTCVFEKSTNEIDRFIFIDRSLEEFGLLVMQNDHITMNKVTKLIKQPVTKTGQESDIGLPTSCYKLELTGPGYDVRTLLTYTFAERLANKPSSD